MCAYRNMEQQIFESSPRQVNPLPSSSTFFRATGESTFCSSSPKSGVNIHPKGRKKTLGLLFRTNSCSSQRLCFLAELRGLFIASQCFISTPAALRGRGSSQTSGTKSPVECVRQACPCTCWAAGGKPTSKQGHMGYGRGVATCHKVCALDLPVLLPKATTAP